jgi:NAD(P)-dependent dehydrogenase (short-subunit alcohol dehydrogenase family)
MSIKGVELKDERVVVTGGSRGLGRGIVEALLARGAQVTVIARDPVQLADVERLGAAARPGDVTDPALMNAVVADVKPSVLILNAGATPLMAPLDAQSWDAFTAVWNTDVKAGLYGIQAALKAPLVDGARADRVERRRHRGEPAVGRVCRRETNALAHGPLRERPRQRARPWHSLPGAGPAADRRRDSARSQGRQPGLDAGAYRSRRSWPNGMARRSRRGSTATTWRRF